MDMSLQSNVSKKQVSHEPKFEKQVELPSWNLQDLYQAPSDPRIDEDVKASLKRAKSFKEKYQGNLVKLSAKDLCEALEEYASIHEQSDKTIIYAHLLHAADSSKPEHGALLSKLEEAVTEIHQESTFFSLEWNTLSDEHVEKLVNDTTLAKYKHYLQNSRIFKPYQLSEKEEVLWQSVSLTGGSAWSRLFDETIARLRFKIKLNGEDKEMTEEEILSLLYSPERSVRQDAAKSLTEGLKSQAPLLTYIFNILVQEHSIEDRIRKLPHAKKSRNLSNEIEDQAVEALIQTTESQVALVHRFYKLKRKLLGLDELCDYDRYAPLPSVSEKKWEWTEAEQFVLDSYQSFSPKFGAIVKEFYDKNWIDAAIRPGKRGGAFSASTVPSLHPYILVNFTGTSRDLSTLAHELGHGIHQYLSRSVGYLESDTPLTTAETASVFGEMLTFDRLVEKASSKKEKLSLLVTKIDEIIATVFRQVYMTRFEEKLHAARREQGELTTAQVNSLWAETNKKMFGDSVTLTEDYSHWWLYITHFIHSPFYCYAYAFGLLLSITLYSESKVRGPEFVEQYTKILSLGGSVNPVELLKIANIDITHSDFWLNGFKLIESMIEQAEKLAD
jgi:oligoendopeptidase F